MSYEVLKNRMYNGTPFLRNVAVTRINWLANNFEISQEQAENLVEIANAKGLDIMPQNITDRLSAVEAESKENRQAIEALVEKRVL